MKLAVEVAWSSVRHDHDRKVPLHESAGIPEYWIIDVKAPRIIRLSDPGPDGYRQSDEVEIGDRVAALTMPELVVDTSYLPMR